MPSDDNYPVATLPATRRIATQRIASGQGFVAEDDLNIAVFGPNALKNLPEQAPGNSDSRQAQRSKTPTGPSESFTSIAQTNDLDDPAGSDRFDQIPEPVRRKPWTRWVSGLFFAAMLAGLYANRSLATHVMGELHRISVRSMIWLAILLVAHKLSHGVMHAASVPGMKLRRSIVATEAYVGASNSVVGGAGIGTALRVAMYRSWGVSTEGVALAIWATALAPSFAMWTMAGVHTLPRFVVFGSGTNAEKFTAVASIGFLAVSAVFWTFALRSPKPLAVLARFGERSRSKFLTVIPSRVSQAIGSSKATTLNVGESLENLRKRAKSLGGRRKLVLFAGALAGQFLMATTLLACVRALGVPSSDVDAFAVYRAFALLRVLSSFLPIPGGLGVLDVGLLGVLSASGVAKPTAIAAIALYRGLTFVLPMFTGSICAFGWRASSACAEHRAARGLDLPPARQGNVILSDYMAEFAHEYVGASANGQSRA